MASFVVDVERERRRKVPPAPGHSLRDWTMTLFQRGRQSVTQRPVTKEEVMRHDSLDDMWMVLKGNVYDVTEFAKYHPGGREILMQTAGRDATVMYNKYHPWFNFDALLSAHCIGPLDRSTHSPSSAERAARASAGGGGPLPDIGGDAVRHHAQQSHSPKGFARGKDSPRSPSRSSDPPAFSVQLPTVGGDPPAFAAPIPAVGVSAPAVGVSPSASPKKGFKKSGKPGPAKPTSPLPWSPGQPITPAIVASSVTLERLWVVIYGKIYDVSKFMDEHPGGGEILMRYAGEDASSEFDKYHSQSAKQQLQEFFVADNPRSAGDLLTAFSHKPAAPRRAPEVGPLSLDFRKVKLVKSTSLTHDTKRMVFELPPAPAPLKVVPGGHVSLKLGSSPARSYTPTSVTETSVELVVKVYAGGALTPLLHALQEGEEVEMRGPLPCEFELTPSACDGLILVAGGTGAAPVYQLARAACEAGLRAHVVVCDKSRDDALLVEELSALKQRHSDLFRLRRVYSRGDQDAGQLPSDTDSAVGGRRFDASAASSLLPAAADRLPAVVCGPRSFNRDVAGALRAAGHQRVTTLGDVAKEESS
eukprot:TRINITY_DN43470_c0_g1_i1.p1 TRINITY_DN43470_c0_g1~~TRINITY_DN43470_c0_g1_i1.p1  ORF type:complete len:615 (+),score=121.78 TRINITY_DN43470_c0_g1_i1:83-1846(+)